ncbi:hypothetical protein [Gordonia malaquae]|uniref:hypothetical protein n=1 Tax=Gordonia malaquae TaxID=410332 RepID=UPI00301AA09D
MGDASQDQIEKLIEHLVTHGRDPDDWMVCQCGKWTNSEHPHDGHPRHVAETWYETVYATE